ncbi:uncharacterized protein EV422DRAFT_507001 [Fimicolochytrium jonesii]|uniref:uncharacterized protein n=1 Tax=Fimicolochytrium jonesii TaxID=1396493 RepID=UPI0022FDBA94|nr:uncharacterized protein EV422DRAFT_507001 [Fimicolochytrium jonesii]KAI8820295.1 hypothetical protein EV422DRAFT_507001 [Fimicolochytrium jonesii]
MGIQPHTIAAPRAPAPTQRFITRGVAIITVLALVTAVCLRQFQNYTCMSQACSERDDDYAYQNLVTVYAFYGFSLFLGIAVYAAQHRRSRQWAAVTAFKIGRCRVSRMRIFVWTAVIVFQVLVFAYWWDAANKVRVEQMRERMAKGGAATGGHRRRAEMAHDTEIHIPFTFDIFCSNMFRASAHPLAIQLALALLPISRRGILSSLLNIDYDDSLQFHRWSGAASVLFAFLHGAAHEAPGFRNRGFVGQMQARFKPAATYRNGISLIGFIAALIFLWVGLNAIPYIRRNNYTWFYLNHMLAFVGIGLAFLHASPMFYLSLPALAVYVFDLATRLYSRHRDTCHIIDVRKEDCGYLRVDIAGWEGVYTPGQWVSVKIPELSHFMWHPFTIASAPAQKRIGYVGPDIDDNGRDAPVTVYHDDEVPRGEEKKAKYRRGESQETVLRNTSDAVPVSNVITLIIKPTNKQGRWTSSLIKLWEKRKGEEGHSPIKILVDGPHGNLPLGFLESPHIVAIAGGSGIPGALSIANHVLSASNPHLDQSVDFVWTAREEFAGKLSAFAELQEAHGAVHRENVERLRELHVRQRRASSSSDGRQQQDYEYIEVEPESTHTCNFNLSSATRLDVFATVAEIMDRHAEADDVSIYACGPRTLLEAVADAVGVARKRRTGRMVLHLEGYER